MQKLCLFWNDDDMTDHPVHEQHDEDEREDEGEEKTTVTQQTEPLAFPEQKIIMTTMTMMMKMTKMLTMMTIISPAQPHWDVFVRFLLLEGHLLQRDLLVNIILTLNSLMKMIRMIIVNGDEERPPIKQSLESYHENFNFKEKNEEKNIFNTSSSPSSIALGIPC